MASTAHGAQRPAEPGPERELPSAHGSAAAAVPVPVRVAAAWSWRVLVVAAAVGVAGYLLSTVTVVVVPVLLAGLLAGLLFPLTKWARSHRVPAGAAAGATVLGLVGFVVGLLVLAGQQIVVGFAELSGSVVAGTGELLDRLQDTPLNFGTGNLEAWVTDLGATVQDNSEALLDGALSFGATAGHVLTGILVLLFTLLFLLADGERIWLFVVGLFPLPARRAVNGAGRNGWEALVQYARAQGLVAAIDAVGIGTGAAVLGVPLALPIGILVFLGSFIPIVGAVATGAVAVLVALVANGTTNALLMLGVVVLVQQLEGNVLQPLILGKAVSLHPLAVFLAVATGSILYGIAGALFAVPILAFANTVARYLLDGTWRTDERIASQPFYYPWEIRRHARRHQATHEQLLAQLERFHRTRTLERRRARSEDRNAEH
ncbi:AI-2E family transporter [Kocuria sp. CNJ-770]|uniref:AI-2E family transporter n=1 Tax=Kocuria sp. CNJ-770 TaxID=1904964 RepID=UPI00096AC61A|nr:AI-2E family transporter [Kocuria sp. CNJ-770]